MIRWLCTGHTSFYRLHLHGRGVDGTPAPASTAAKLSPCSAPSPATAGRAPCPPVSMRAPGWGRPRSGRVGAGLLDPGEGSCTAGLPGGRKLASSSPGSLGHSRTRAPGGRDASSEAGQRRPGRRRTRAAGHGVCRAGGGLPRKQRGRAAPSVPSRVPLQDLERGPPGQASRDTKETSEWKEVSPLSSSYLWPCLGAAQPPSVPSPPGLCPSFP